MQNPLFLLFLFFIPPLIWADNSTPSEFTITLTPAKTLRLLADNTPLHDKPEGTIHQHWDKGTLFTSNKEHGEWIKVTGHFPDKTWQPMPAQKWINKKQIEDITPPALFKRAKNSTRYIVIDKATFELRIIERVNGIEQQLYSTTVGLGMDGCLTAQEGGNCYYTEAGEYHVRWKVYDPDGIEWCVPKDMEQESKYKDDVAAGKSCYQGALGRFALNIGKTYAIHGTNNLDSIGKNASHGCVRSRNSDMEDIWRYMEVGDKVTIVE